MNPPPVNFTPTTAQKALYTRAESRLRRTLGSVAQRLDAGEILPHVAFFKAALPLRDATRECFLLGKRVGMGGLPVLLTPAEEARAALLYDTQAAHLRAWLMGGGPVTKAGGAGVGPRMDMYALSVHAAYQAGLAFGLLQSASNLSSASHGMGVKGTALHQDDPLWLWERSRAPGLASCADCTAREVASRTVPYSLTQLLAIGFPAGGKTRCLSRCRCRVRLRDGFLTPSFNSSGGEAGGMGAVLRARAHGRAKPTAYHGVASPDALAAAHGATVGPGRPPK